MNDDDEAELHRLCNQLEQISRLDLTEAQQEALRKAGYALAFAMIDQRRVQIEELYDSDDAGLTEAQEQHLRSMGIEIDAGEEDADPRD